MIVVVPIGHRLAGRKIVRLEDLRDEPFVLYPRTTQDGMAEMVVSVGLGQRNWL